MHHTLVAAAAALLLVGPARAATVLVNETFDYATTAEMQAVWGSTGLGTLETSRGRLAPSARHPGGAVNELAVNVLPTDAAPLVFSADIFDDSGTTNTRLTVGLRNGTNPLFEMGMYNSGGHYSTRILGFGGNEGWVPLRVGEAIKDWHRFTATFTSNAVTVTFDAGADGTVDSTVTSTGTPLSRAFTSLRFGGPSSLAGNTNIAYFDNITLTVIPEPAALGVLAAAAGLCLRRRRGSA